MHYPIDEYSRKSYIINDKGEKVLVDAFGNPLPEIIIPAYMNVKHAKKEASPELPREESKRK